MALSVSALHVYPVKSCRGIAVSEVRLVERGFAQDRRYMVVDGEGMFVTQRTDPRLALVDTAIAGGTLRLSAPGRPPLELPLQHEDGDRLEVEVWRHRGPGVRHEAGSAWFSEHLGSPHQLVYMPDDHRRPVDPAFGRPSDVTAFSDGYPLLVISEASLEDLNRRLAAPIPMARFRPNIVVRGAEPFAEDSWRRFVIGGVAFRGVKPCSRCTVTTVDATTGTRGKEPLTTLATFRQRDGNVFFGMNLVHDGPGVLRTGDSVEILES